MNPKLAVIRHTEGPKLPVLIAGEFWFALRLLRRDNSSLGLVLSSGVRP